MRPEARERARVAVRIKDVGVLRRRLTDSETNATTWSLFSEAQRGSPEARTEIVRRHWDDAYRVTFLLTQDRGASEDLAQEAIVAALGALDSFDDSRPFVPWLRRIAANKAYDWLRRRESRPEIVHTDLALAAQDSEKLADKIATAAVSDELVGALGRLDPRYRAAVVLRYLVELQPQEIAENLGAESATVRTRIHRGLKLL